MRVEIQQSDNPIRATNTECPTAKITLTAEGSYREIAWLWEQLQKIGNKEASHVEDRD